MPDNDPFSFSGAGFTEDYTGTVVSVEFAPGQYNFQATITNRYDEPVVGDDGEVRTERKVFVTIGGNDQWQALDGGRAFGHVTGENYAGSGRSKVRGNSGWARLVQRMVELAGVDALKAKGSPFEASMLEGWHLHWVTEGDGEPYKFTDKVTGEEKSGVTKGYPMPVEILGGAEAAPAFEIGSLGLPADVERAIVDCANDADTEAVFKSKVMPIIYTDVPADKRDDLAKIVANGGWGQIRELI
jgi:hypothetical protein